MCLSLMASCTEDSIVGHVLPFVKEHLTNNSWQYRDSAIMALGAIMEGPDPGNMTTVITDAGVTMPSLLLSACVNGVPLQVTEKIIELMSQDDSVQVRDTAAWTLGRICEQSPNVVLRESMLMNLLMALGGGLDREPRVATNVCWVSVSSLLVVTLLMMVQALSSLAEAAYDAVDNNGDDPTTYCLSPHYEAIVTKLIQTTERYCHSHILTLSHSQPTLSHSHLHTITCPSSRYHTHILTLSHIFTLSHSHLHTITCPSSHYHTHIFTLSHSLSFSCRTDASQSNLRTAAYESLMEIIKFSAQVLRCD